MINSKFEKIFNDYPMSYRKALEEIIASSSEEFVIRYLFNCVSILRPLKTGLQQEKNYDIYDLIWSNVIRRAIDYYLITGECNGSRHYINKITPDIPLLYSRKYTSKQIKEIEEACGVQRWTVTCDRVASFLEEYNLTLDDVYFTTQSPPGDHYSSLIAERGSAYKWARTYLYIVSKNKKIIKE